MLAFTRGQRRWNPERSRNQGAGTREQAEDLLQKGHVLAPAHWGGTDLAHQNEKKTVQSLQQAWSQSSCGRGRGPSSPLEARLHLRQKSQCRNGTEAATTAGGRARSPVGRRRWRRSHDQHQAQRTTEAHSGGAESKVRQKQSFSLSTALPGYRVRLYGNQSCSG